VGLWKQLRGNDRAAEQQLRPDNLQAQWNVARTSFRAATAAEDWPAVERDWHLMDDLRARIAGFPGSDGFIGIGIESMKACLTMPEVTELGLPADRERELRLGLAEWSGDPRGQAAVTEASLLGLKMPLHWPRFFSERKIFVEANYEDDMWGPLLDVNLDSSWSVPELSSSSLGARAILAHMRAVEFRRSAPLKHIEDRLGKTAPEVTNDLQELESLQFAQVATIEDRLKNLTVPVLKELHSKFGLAGKGTKPKLVDALTEMDEMELEREIANYGTDNADSTEWAFGLGAGKEAKWFVMFCALTAHWLEGCAAKWSETSASSGWEILDDSDCPVCRIHKKRVKTRLELPPFHIGCRCCAAPYFK